MLHDDVRITAVVHPDCSVEVVVEGDWDLADPLFLRTIVGQAEEALNILGGHVAMGFPPGVILKDASGLEIVVQEVRRCAG